MEDVIKRYDLLHDDELNNDELIPPAVRYIVKDIINKQPVAKEYEKILESSWEIGERNIRCELCGAEIGFNVSPREVFKVNTFERCPTCGAHMKIKNAEENEK